MSFYLKVQSENSYAIRKSTSNLKANLCSLQVSVYTIENRIEIVIYYSMSYS